MVLLYCTDCAAYTYHEAHEVYGGHYRTLCATCMMRWSDTTAEKARYIREQIERNPVATNIR